MTIPYVSQKSYTTGLPLCSSGDKSSNPNVILGLKGKPQLGLEMYRAVRLYHPDSDIFVDVKMFIACRRYETLTLHRVLQHFSTSACDWFAPATAHVIKQTRVSVSDSLKRRELLEDFLFWYFDSFVLPLLKVRIDPSKSYHDHCL